MKNEIKNLKNETLRVLMYDKSARSDDMRLYTLVLRNMGLPTDVSKLEGYGSNIFETISRTRRKIQVENPMLYEKRTKEYREHKTKYYKEFAHE